MAAAARFRSARSLCFLAAFVLAGTGPAAADWTTRGSGEGIEAGTVIDGTFAGLRLRCRGGGAVELALTHNGAVFDRGRAYTIVVSVDGTATLLTAVARASGRSGDDDFVHEGSLASLGPLLRALASGREVELSAPSARYTLSLAGSGRALTAFRESCSAG